MGSCLVKMVIILPPRRSNNHHSYKEKILIRCSISLWRIYVKIQLWRIKISAISSNCIWLERSKICINTRICWMRWQHFFTRIILHKTYQKPSQDGVKHSKPLKKLLRNRSYRRLTQSSSLRSKLKNSCSKTKPRKSNSSSKSKFKRHLDQLSLWIRMSRQTVAPRSTSIFCARLDLTPNKF